MIGILVGLAYGIGAIMVCRTNYRLGTKGPKRVSRTVLLLASIALGILWPLIAALGLILGGLRLLGVLLGVR